MASSGAPLDSQRRTVRFACSCLKRAAVATEIHAQRHRDQDPVRRGVAHHQHPALRRGLHRPTSRRPERRLRVPAALLLQEVREEAPDPHRHVLAALAAGATGGVGRLFPLATDGPVRGRDRLEGATLPRAVVHLPQAWVGLHPSPRTIRSAVSRARNWGLVMTRSNATWARRRPSASAWRRPSALMEMSMCWPMCWSGTDRSVRPWRVRTSVSIAASLGGSLMGEWPRR